MFPIPFPAPESGASAGLGCLDSEPSNEPFPTELRPSTVVDNLVVLKHFLLDVDVSEFSIFCVQDIGSVLLVLDVLFTEDPIEGYGTAESELLSDFCCGVRLADVREDSDALFSIDACLAFFLEGGEELDTEFRVVQNLIDDILGGVDAMLADRRYDITSKPLLERQGCGPDPIWQGKSTDRARK